MGQNFQLKSRTVAIDFTDSFAALGDADFDTAFNSLGEGLNLRFALPGVQSVDVAYQLTVAETYGLTVSFLQPWYLKNIPVTIKGEEYIGAFAQQQPQAIEAVRDNNNAPTSNPSLQTLPRTTDDAVESFLALFRGLSKLINKGINLQAALRIGQQNEANFIELKGFFIDVSFTENVTKPFVLDYTVKFIGKDPLAVAQDIALTASTKDLTKISGSSAST